MARYKPQKEEIQVEPDEKAGYVRDFITGRWLKDKPEEGPRQILEKRLVEEYGYSKNQMEIEFLVQKGSKKIGPTDITVFRNEKKTIDNFYIIVETKRKERKDGIDQLKSYLSPTNAEFGIWFNGKDIVYLQHLKKTPFFREIPDIPKKGETLEDVGLYQKKDLKPAVELKAVFETIHNYIYANEGLLKEKVFNEMLKLIFIKMADEKALAQKCEFRITDKELNELEGGKENGFIKRILSLFERVKNQYQDVFDLNEKLNLGPLTIAFVVSQLQKYSLISTPTDVKGTAFQTFVYAHQRGERGEFFTPHPIIDLCVNILDPKDNEKIIDPACGSGGFLVATMNYIKEKFIKERPELEDRAADFLKDYAHAYISGIDINPDLAKVAKMHMVLHDDGHSGIFCANSLLPIGELIKVAEDIGVPRSLRPYSNNFKILMTNPPFGSKGKVTDKKILREFELGYKWKKEDKEWIKDNKVLDGQVPEILFIERCIQLLCNGGKMAIVLPDSIFTNSSLEHVRNFILKNVKIIAVISLPSETFVPHGAGVKASVLFLQKCDPKDLKKIQKDDYNIFMAKCKKIGYRVLKNKAFPMYRVDKNHNKVIDSDTKDIYQDFQKFLDDGSYNSDKSYNIRYSEIINQTEKRIDSEYYTPQQKLNIKKIFNISKKKNWRVRKLKEIAQVKKGIEIGSEGYKELGIPYIRVQNLSEIGFSDNNLAYINKDLYDRIKNHNPNPREILYSKDATIGIAYLIDGSEFDENKFITSGGIVRIKIRDENIIVPEFLVTMLNSEFCKLQSERESIGSVIKHISIDKIEEMLILCPPLKYQQEIIELTKKSYKARKEADQLLQRAKKIIREKIIE